MVIFLFPASEPSSVPGTSAGSGMSTETSPFFVTLSSEISNPNPGIDTVLFVPVTEPITGAGFVPGLISFPGAKNLLSSGTHDESGHVNSSSSNPYSGTAPCGNCRPAESVVFDGMKNPGSSDTPGSMIGDLPKIIPGFRTCPDGKCGYPPMNTPDSNVKVLSLISSIEKPSANSIPIGNVVDGANVTLL